MKYLIEAMDISGEDSPYINPNIKSKIESDKPILPFFGSKENIEKVASNEFKNAVNNVRKYIGNPQSLMMAMSKLMDIIEIEGQHKPELEQLAIDTVLNLSQFKKLKEIYDNGQIEFDVEITGMPIDMDELGANWEEDTSNTITDEMLRIINNLDDKVYLRKFANTMIQGAGSYNFYLYQMCKNELDKISPSLYKYYGMVMSASMLMYWMAPEQTGKMGAAGSEQVSFKKDKNIISAKGIIFPVLLYELIKAIYEIPAMVGQPEDYEQIASEEDTISNERFQVMLGSKLWKKFIDYFTPEEQAYIPVVFSLLLQKAKESDVKKTIESIFTGNQPSNNVINELKKIARE